MRDMYDLVALGLGLVLGLAAGAAIALDITESRIEHSNRAMNLCAFELIMCEDQIRENGRAKDVSLPVEASLW